MTYLDALKALNEAAYTAAAMARKAGAPNAHDIRAVAIQTDDFVDGYRPAPVAAE